MIAIEIPDEILSKCCRQIDRLSRIGRAEDGADWQEITKLNREAAEIQADLVGILAGLLGRAGLVSSFSPVKAREQTTVEQR